MQLPRGLRNNNPGNLEDGPFARRLPGYVGSDGRHAIFDTMDNGYGAMNSLLDAPRYRNAQGIGGVISQWAPASDGNDVGAYTSYVARRMGGVNPNDPAVLSDPAMRQKLVQAMTEYENGTGVPTGGTSMPAALSARNVAGPGALSNNDEGGDLGNALQGAAAWLMAPYTNSKSLSVLPTLENQGKWSFHVGPNGEIVRFNNKTGKPEVLGSLGTRPEYKDVETASGIKRPMIYQNGQLTPVPGAPAVDESTTPNPRLPGEGEQDKTFAKENNLWTSGGFAQSEKALNQLQGVVKELRAPKKPLFQATTQGGGAETFGDVLGPTGPVTGMLPDSVNAIINPKSIDMRDRVADIVQRGAKAVLGSQYTQREGTQLVERAYNPRLSPEINAQRLETTLKQLKEQALAQQAKSAYFRQYGSLKGYQGPEPDFNKIGVFDEEQGSSLPEGWSVKVK